MEGKKGRRGEGVVWVGRREEGGGGKEGYWEGEGRRGEGVVWEGRRMDGRMSEKGREKGREKEWYIEEGEGKGEGVVY